MTKRKDPSEMKIRSRYDLTPQKLVKKGVDATEEGREVRLADLRSSFPDPNKPELFNPDRNLTQKQKLFVKYWAEGDTISNAALRAGYNDGSSMAYRMARDPAILKLYNEEKRLYAESCQMTRKRVMEGLLEGIEMAKIQGDAGNVIAGWKTVGQMAGFFEPVRRKVDINIKGDITMQKLDRLTDAQLLRLIKGEVTDVAFEEITAEESGE